MRVFSIHALYSKVITYKSSDNGKTSDNECDNTNKANDTTKSQESKATDYTDGQKVLCKLFQHSPLLSEISLELQTILLEIEKLSDIRINTPCTIRDIEVAKLKLTKFQNQVNDPLYVSALANLELARAEIRYFKLPNESIYYVIGYPPEINEEMQNITNILQNSSELYQIALKKVEEQYPDNNKDAFQNYLYFHLSQSLRRQGRLLARMGRFSESIACFWKAGHCMKVNSTNPEYHLFVRDLILSLALMIHNLVLAGSLTVISNNIRSLRFPPILKNLKIPKYFGISPKLYKTLLLIKESLIELRKYWNQLLDLLSSLIKANVLLTTIENWFPHDNLIFEKYISPIFSPIKKVIQSIKYLIIRKSLDNDNRDR
jgi:tetratricopeptide (TPR) repeat protein